MTVMIVCLGVPAQELKESQELFSTDQSAKEDQSECCQIHDI